MRFQSLDELRWTRVCYIIVSEHQLQQWPIALIASGPQLQLIRYSCKSTLKRWIFNTISWTHTSFFTWSPLMKWYSSNDKIIISAWLSQNHAAVLLKLTWSQVNMAQAPVDVISLSLKLMICPQMSFNHHYKKFKHFYHVQAVLCRWYKVIRLSTFEYQ